jgi:hypothetical protein
MIPVLIILLAFFCGVPSIGPAQTRIAKYRIPDADLYPAGTTP